MQIPRVDGPDRGPGSDRHEVGGSHLSVRGGQYTQTSVSFGGSRYGGKPEGSCHPFRQHRIAKREESVTAGEGVGYRRTAIRDP